MTIKSNYLENLSVRTPQSQISKGSMFSTRSASNNVKLLQTSQNWLKYRQRPKYDSVHRGEQSGADGAPGPIVEDDKPKVPYPFLSAFIERRTGNRFTKRVKFDPTQTDQDKFLQQIIEQINHNSEKKEAIQKKKKSEDSEFLVNLRQKMLLDQ